MSSRAHRLERPLRLSRRAAGLAVIALLILTAAAFPLRQHFEQQAKIRELEGRIDTLIEERSSLEVEVRRLQDPEYLERLARRCLGMVRPGEVALVTVPDDGGVPRNSC